MTLADAFNAAASQRASGWLYLAGEPHEWRLESDAFFLTLEGDPETDETVFPPEVRELGLHEVLEAATIEDVVSWADRLTGQPSAAARLEGLIYYYRFDAFLPSLGAPDPPSLESSRRAMDLEFYERLGAEDLSRPCRHESCPRGAVAYSVYCRPHHFEMVEHRPCPYQH